MWVVAFTLSIAVAILGAVGIVAPQFLLAIAEILFTPTGLYIAAALRIALGTALFIAAPASRFPRTLRIVGVLIVVAGLATPLIGLERGRAIVEWETARGSMFMRVPATFALVFGLFLAYATGPGGRTRAGR